jgi:hypothetical protein
LLNIRLLEISAFKVNFVPVVFHSSRYYSIATINALLLPAGCFHS